MQPNNSSGSLPNNFSGLPKKHHANWWLILFILSFVFLIAALGFGFWAYSSRQDYKQNTDQKIEAAVEVAKQQTSTAKDNEFVEKEKLPLKNYQSPEAYGSVLITYPKTWSAYVVEQSTNSGTPVDGFFHPGFVPNVAVPQNSFALRVQVVSNSYSQELKKFDSLIKLGKTKVTPFVAAKVPSVAGSRVDGQFDSQKGGSMVLFPLRDKTLKIWTEADQFKNDFNNNVLPNLTFIP